MPFIVDDIAAGAAAVSAISNIAASVTKKIGAMFSGSPPCNWSQANAIALPMATDMTKNIVATVGADKVPAIFNSYTSKLQAYIKTSPHNPTQTSNFVQAIQTEAIGMGGGFRFDAFPFSVPVQTQLAWAIWLHAMWLYGGSSQNDVANGGALTKFQASLAPTLIAAVQEATGATVDKTGTNTNPAASSTVSGVTSSLSSLTSNPIVLIALVGAGLFMVSQYKGGR